MSEHADVPGDAEADVHALSMVEELRRLIEADAEALRREQAAPARLEPVELPDLPEKCDLLNEPEEPDAFNPDVLNASLARFGNDLRPIRRARATRRTPIFRPFPSDALPEPVRGFVELGAEAIGCDKSCLALPMLAGLASAIGNSRRLRLKRGFSVPAIIWSAIVGESGTAKSAAFGLALRPFRDRQWQALGRHASAMRQYKADMAEYEAARRDWERVLRGDEPVEKPVRPQVERSVVIDTTVEALGPLLSANPRGLLLARDELAGWVGVFDRYAEGKGGAEAGHWLAMYEAASIVIDRKSRAAGSMSVERAAVCVTGCLQPAGFRRAVASGLAARLVLSWPPFVPQNWSETEMDPEAEAKIAQLIDRLYELQPEADACGEPPPVVLELTPEAKSGWKRFYNSHFKGRDELPTELSAARSKLAEYAARLALVVHCLRWAADDPQLEDAERVDAASLGAAVELTRWFKGEARRVYALVGISGGDSSQRKLTEWIERKGGSVTAREVQQGHRCYATAAEAQAALDDLAEAGEGRWETAPSNRRGGRPKRCFRLTSVYETSADPEENRVS